MDLLRHNRPRVVITGMGAISPLGTLDTLWDNLKAGCSGIRRLENIETGHLGVKIGGEVRSFNPADYGIQYKDARRMGRSTQFAIAAALMAVADAGFDAGAVEQIGERAAVVIGTSLGPHEMAEQNTFKYKTSGYAKPNPLALVNSLPNMPAHYVSRQFQALGPLCAPVTACAAGTQAVGDASELIRNRRADVVIAGGVEAMLTDYTIAGFEAMHALADGFNDAPHAASRPFDRDRAGFVISEGCGIVILENLHHALKRGARIYAEVLGYASSSDAYHVAALDPSARGAMRAMRWALEDACLNPDAIDYINAHGTSTPANDPMETSAIKQLFGPRAYNIPVSSTKSMLGHTLGASGALEAIACAKALQEQVVPPTINYETPDPACDLDYVPNVAREVSRLRYTLSNSFGLGGQNASLVLGTLVD